MVSVRILKKGNNYLSKFISYKTRPNQLVIYRDGESCFPVEVTEMSDAEWNALKEAI